MWNPDFAIENRSRLVILALYCVSWTLFFARRTVQYACAKKPHLPCLKPKFQRLPPISITKSEFKKALSLLVISLLFLHIVPGSLVKAEPSVDATSAILIDGQTGRVLWSKNPYAKRPIASTTKIMTGLIAIEQSSPEEVVTTDKAAEKTAESEIFLEKNEKMTVMDMLYALLVQSANDSAVALAKHISGSVPAFIDLMMNKKASALGLKNTNFSNPHGLWDANISTAYDMAQLGRVALKNPAFAQIVKTKQIVIRGKTKRKIFNRNKLLWRYKYAVGIKTGYTRKAGYCLVSAAKKGNMLLIATTLNSKTHDSSFNNAKGIFEYGFSDFKYVSVAKRGQTKAKVDIPFSFEKMNLAAEDNFGVIISKKSKINTKFHLRKDLTLPIRKGSTLGHIKVFEGKKLIATKALKAQRNAPEVGITGRISYWIKYLFKKLIPGLD